jgi:beta-lactamase regulating signal transducer with metallopeptidase domain
VIDWLLKTLLATSGLVLFVLLVREPVRKRFGSRVAYGLWLIPVARLFMPTLTHTVERTVPVQVSIQPFPQPLASESLWMARVAPADPSLLDRLGGWPTILFAVWLAVAAGLFFSRLIAFHRDRRAILASSVQIAELGSVRIIRTPEVDSPVALGILDRIIAVPSDFDRRYADRERRLVLDHELAHHHSGDLVANLFAFVLLCLQWFNPLAWAAHAAFRFDQEAACDARVLDKVNADDRADYGRAIAKAASGRALLFASALDRRNSLHRRLQSMLRSPNPGRRTVGRLMVVSAIAIALPLTASRAVEYLDVAVPAPAAVPAVPAVPAPAPVVSKVVTRIVPAAAVVVQPVAPIHPVQPSSGPTLNSGDMTINEDRVTIDGQAKRWEDLTPEERARVRAAVVKARESLANTHIDQAKILESVRNIPDRKRMAEIQREVQQAQANAAQAAQNINISGADLRRWGVNPEQLQANIRTALQSVQTIDLSALQTIDRDKITADVSGAQQSMEKAKAELARIQARLDAEDRK